MSGKPLVNNDQSIPLYDASCMLQVDAQMAHGFVVLLSGKSFAKAPKEQSRSNKHKVDDNTVMLGFLALTQGNVVDACFGITRVQDKKKKSSIEQAKRVKNLIADAADSSDGIRYLAVEAYRQAFQEISDFHQQVSKLNFFTSCFRLAKIQHDTEMLLKAAFAQLQEAVAAAV
jgi:hypothetical protein